MSGSCVVQHIRLFEVFYLWSLDLAIISLLLFIFCVIFFTLGVKEPKPTCCCTMIEPPFFPSTSRRGSSLTRYLFSAVTDVVVSWFHTVGTTALESIICVSSISALLCVNVQERNSFSLFTTSAALALSNPFYSLYISMKQCRRKKHLNCFTGILL